jgi:hypothetical protein
MFHSRRDRESDHIARAERDREALDLVKWNITRYDQIRASTASRASLLVSANALLLAGTTLLLNGYDISDAHKNWKQHAITICFALAVVTTFTSIAISIWYCVGAVSAYKRRRTSRQVFRNKLPSRFIFNWGDTLRTSEDFQAFLSTLRSSTSEDTLKAASAELWSVIYQHSTKHRSLRMGIRFFRFSLLAFVALAIMALAHKFS